METTGIDLNPFYSTQSNKGGNSGLKPVLGKIPYTPGGNVTVPRYFDQNQIPFILPNNPQWNDMYVVGGVLSYQLLRAEWISRDSYVFDLRCTILASGQQTLFNYDFGVDVLDWITEYSGGNVASMSLVTTELERTASALSTVTNNNPTEVYLTANLADVGKVITVRGVVTFNPLSKVVAVPEGFKVEKNIYPVCVSPFIDDAPNARFMALQTCDISTLVLTPGNYTKLQIGDYVKTVTEVAGKTLYLYFVEIN